MCASKSDEYGRKMQYKVGYWPLSMTVDDNSVCACSSGYLPRGLRRPNLEYVSCWSHSVPCRERERKMKGASEENKNKNHKVALTANKQIIIPDKYFFTLQPCLCRGSWLRWCCFVASCPGSSGALSSPCRHSYRHYSQMTTKMKFTFFWECYLKKKKKNLDGVIRKKRLLSQHQL